LLPTGARLRTRSEFQSALRHARRLGGPTVVVHLARDGSGPARVGFIVGRTVGPAVSRNRLRRQLRHLLRERLPRLPAGTRLVVRGLPAAAGRSSAELGHDLDALLGRATGAAG